MSSQPARNVVGDKAGAVISLSQHPNCCWLKVYQLADRSMVALMCLAANVEPEEKVSAYVACLYYYI